MARAARGRKKVKKNVPRGIVHIQATFNNTIVTITDMQEIPSLGNSGNTGFKGSRKAHPMLLRSPLRSCQPCQRTWVAGSGSQSQRSWLRSGSCHSCIAGGRSIHPYDQGCYSDSTQWLPSSSAPPGVSLTIREIQAIEIKESQTWQDIAELFANYAVQTVSS